MTALAAAHEELDRRLQAADRAGDWQEYAVLSHLVDVADHTKRVGDHPTPHYRADKAGPLLDAAIRLQRDVFLAYAAWPDEDTATDRQVREAVKVLQKAADVVRGVLWRTTEAELHGEPPLIFRSQAREVTGAAAEFTRWAKSVADSARPDPEGDL